MPVMDGFDSSRNILNYAQENHLKKPVIIALTAFVNAENIDKCKEIGMLEVLHKPAIWDKIDKAIRDYTPDLSTLIRRNSIQRRYEVTRQRTKRNFRSEIVKKSELTSAGSFIQ